MNLPNQLTLLRILLSFLLLLFVLLPGFFYKSMALACFVVASLTDFWDGRLARKWNMVTDFGVLMDPIADKVLVLSSFGAFIQLGVVPAWMVVAIACREFLVTGMRMFASGKGHVLAAEAAGKHKTVSQMVAIALILIFLVIREWIPEAAWLRDGEQAIWVLMLITVIFTLTSGFSFFWNNRKLVLSL